MKLMPRNLIGIEIYKMIVDKQQYLSKIYDDYADSIYRFLLIKTSSVETAQDLTSETFLRFVKTIVNRGVRPPSQERSDPPMIQNPRAFLYKTARNLTIDYYRKKSKTVFLENDLRGDGNIYDDAVLDDISGIAQKFDLEKDVLRVQKTLLKLQDECAEVIILRYIEEMSFSEISEIVGKPEGTIRVILHRAIKELRENL